ncbi:hypothetical protein OHS70_02450 [Streptomyces sp. NBC_00390]|uniref:hypothetical protein n=1 Tax=Streptomyces sp. NBC_00390 TaxID=2975736 RepID=UPI002E1E6871
MGDPWADVAVRRLAAGDVGPVGSVQGREGGGGVTEAHVAAVVGEGGWDAAAGAAAARKFLAA